MCDTPVTATRPARAEDDRDERRKIRILAVPGTYHTNPPEILAQRGSQRAARAALPDTPAHPHPNATDTGEALTMATKALYRVTEAMAILSLSRSVIYELMRNGRLRSVKEGTSRLIPARAIAEYVALLERESMGEAA